MTPVNTISVVITAFNSDKYIAEAIECVLTQTRLPDEIIVIDDGSIDNTRKIAESYRNDVQYVYQINSGPSASRNKGMEHARSEIVSFLDADDLWLPDKLLKQAEAFISDSELDMAFTYIQNFYSTELDPALVKGIHAPMEKMPGYVPSTFSIKKKSFAKVGTFDSSLRMGEFIDWYSRAKNLPLREVMIPHILVRRRLHTENLGITKRSIAHQDYLKIVRQKLKRSSGFQDT